MAASAPIRPARVGARGLVVGLAACAFLAALYAAFPLGRYFSDSHLCVTRVEVGPTPYYNVAYVPIGWLAQRFVGAPLGWSVEHTLTLLSACALAGVVVLGYRLAVRAGAERRWALVWSALVALAPGVWLHAAVVEVHALQALGAVVALHLALGARAATPARAWALLGAAALLALACHLSHVLLVPGLLLVAWTGERGRGVRLGARAAVGLVAAAIAAVAMVFAASSGFVVSHFERGVFDWAQMLRVFAMELFEAWGAHGLRTLPEAAAYLRDEVVGPAGVLLAAPVLVALAWPRLAPGDRRTAVVFALLPLPAALLFSQGGIWERGGYFLSYFPALALAGALASEALLARAPRPALLVVALPLLAAQAALLPGERESLLAQGPDARAWAQRVSAVLAPGDKVLVGSLAKSLALEALRPDVLPPDLARVLDMAPERARLGVAFETIGAYLHHPTHAGAVYLDAALWAGRSEATVEALVAHPAARLTPVAELPEGFGLLRLEAAEAP